MSDEIHAQIRDSLREKTRHAYPIQLPMNKQDTNDGGPASPFGQISEATGQPINGFFAPGLTKREWFAGMALQTALRGQSYREEKYIAEFCVKMADAMLAALKGEQPT